MFHKILLTISAALILSSTALAEFQKVNIQDNIYKVSKPTYYDEGYLQSGNFEDKYEFEMAEGNVLKLKSFFWLTKSGAIKRVTNPGYLVWKLPNGKTLLLNCKEKMDKNRNRVVSFHENLRYFQGCNSMAQHKFTIKNSFFADTRFGGAIDLFDDGSLSYSGKVSEDSYVVKPDGSKAHLFQSSEISLHPNGTPRFFTLKYGEVYPTYVPNFGVINFGTNPEKGKRVAITMDDQGKILSGSPVAPIKAELHGKDVLLNPEAVKMYSTGELGVLILPHWQEFPKSVYQFVHRNRHGHFILCLSKVNSQPVDVKTCVDELAGI